MVHRIINVPHTLEMSNAIHVSHNKATNTFDVFDSKGTHICEIMAHQHKATASDMADVFNKLLAIGFDQGRNFVKASMTEPISTLRR